MSDVLEAFQSFVQEAEPRLRVALVARFGPDRGREATAEALAWAWEHWGRLQETANPVGYLYRVGSNWAKRRRWWSVLPFWRTEATHHDAPWVEPELPRALGSLTGRQRTCVVLVHAFGWTHREVAELLGVSVPTVKTHAQRGLVRLREMLEVTDDA